MEENLKKKLFQFLFVFLIIALILFMIWMFFWIRSETSQCVHNPLQYAAEKIGEECPSQTYDLVCVEEISLTDDFSFDIQVYPEK